MASRRQTNMATASPRKRLPAKFQRVAYYQSMMYNDIIHSQQTAGDSADTLLVCDGGTIRVHAFILQAASPLIRCAFESQGENYPFVREVLLPDFSIHEVEKMLTLVYKGCVELKQEQEVAVLEETLKFFQISSVEFGRIKLENIRGSLKVQELNRIPQDIFKPEVKDETSDKWKPRVVVTGGSANKTSSNDDNISGNQDLRRSGRTSKRILTPKTMRTGSGTHEKSDSDYKAESSVEEASDEEKSPQKRGRPTKLSKLRPVVKLPRIMESVPKPGTSTSAVVTPATPTVPSVPVENSISVSKQETDSEDDGWEKPNFKDKEWFHRESCRCQYCNKSFDKPADASLCITAHRCLRCYFCFQVFTSTDILFKHFNKRHRQAGRDGTLICPYCEQSIPYKSVSCHVISIHLRNKPGEDEKSGAGSRVQAQSVTNSPASNSSGNRRGPGRPSTVSVTPSTPNGSRARPRSRSTSTSTERVRRGSSSKERNPQKKLKSGLSSNGDSGKETKGTKLKFPLKRKTALKNGYKDGELKVPDLNITLEKVTAFNGKTLSFRLQKKRLVGSPIDKS